MKVQFTNLYKANRANHRKIFQKINQLVKDNQFVGGKEVLAFEKEFKKFIKVKYCVSVGNGTDALEIAIESLNLKKGSEIIVPVNTWISTAESVSRSGYKLVFCDIDLGDYTIDIKDLKKKITKKTKLIIPVHLYGCASKMKDINEIARKKNIKILEDCAQAHGTKYKNKKVGTLGDIAIFSFFPGKNLGAYGDGGAIVTNNKFLAKKCKLIKNHGAFNKYDHHFPGRNSRLDTIQASILRIKLKSYTRKINKRNELAKIYYKELKNIFEISLPKKPKDVNHTYHQFVIRLNKRNQLKKYLKENYIQTMIHYPYMLNELSFYKKIKGISSLKNSINLGKRILSLPISEDHSISEIKFVIKKIKKFFKK